jgi:hypothetical protein
MYSDSFASFAEESGNVWAKDNIPNLERDAIAARTEQVQRFCRENGVVPHGKTLNADMQTREEAEEDMMEQANDME